MRKLSNPVPVDGILFVEDAPKEEAVGTLHVPEFAQEQQNYGEVILSSSDSKFPKNTLVMYGKHNGSMMRFNGKTIRVIKESDVLGFQV